MRRRWLILIAVLVGLAAVSYAATRAMRSCHCPPAPHPSFGKLQSYLELTPDQRKAMAEVDEKYAKIRPELHRKLWKAGDELIRVLHDPNSTIEEAKAAAVKFGAAQQEMQLNTISYTYELRKHLTTAQREKLISTMGRGMGALAGGPPPGMEPGCGMGPRHMGPNGPPNHPFPGNGGPGPMGPMGPPGPPPPGRE